MVGFQPVVEGHVCEQSDVQGEWFGYGLCVMVKPRFAAIAQGIDFPMTLRRTHILSALKCTRA